MATQLWAAGLVLTGALIGSLGPIYLKKASDNLSLNPLKLIQNKNLIIGLFFYGISTILFIPALRGGDLSVLYPLVATGYIWVSLLSVRLLGEKMFLQKWLGIIFILVGVIFIGLGA